MKVEGDFLVFNREVWDYDIPLRELSTADGLEKWCCHMTEKNWFSLADAMRMIKFCENRFGYEFSGRIHY